MISRLSLLSVYEGYEFEYEHDCSEDRAEIWINKEAKMAVRIEWMKMDEVEP